MPRYVSAGGCGGLHWLVHYSALSTHLEEVRELLNENKNLKALEEERDRLDKPKDALNEARGAYDEFIDNEEDRKAS